jgi:transglutaminase-like putative cysteine protease
LVTAGSAGAGALIGGMVDAGHFSEGNWSWSSEDGLSEKGAREGAIWGAAIGGGIYLIMWLLGIFDSPSTPPTPTPFVPLPVPAPLPLPQVQPKQYPTITSEELQKVELAYAETVRDIERRGKRLYIYNSRERAAFIQRYQGKPNTVSIIPVSREIFPTPAEKYYDSRRTSETDIVSIAKNEPNEFRKVRMIHDWISDIFSYDYDYRDRMIYVTGRNEEYTLGEIVKRKRGVCFEYAILFYFLMDAAGVDTYLISDHSKPGIGHAYNMVVINGTGYIIDTTWDSKNQYEGGRITQFAPPCTTEYFLLGISESYKERGW